MEKKQNDRIVDDLKDICSKIIKLADDIAEVEFKESFFEILTWQDCKNWFLSNCGKNKDKTIGGFVISIKENKNPQNDRDNFTVIQVLIDTNKKPVVVNGETVSCIIHTRTLDDAFIRIMGGNEKQIFMK